ncbi:protein of unknown function [Sterolibacterium denitrificans]|uniref:Uncharacterized protein n=1 Tax=Sterolibacterium denitrificans TaxID=157592 RepID=A0A7Z7HTA3_9PROT|nr:protein of unknown function [Sterolibacterium denitrificans]
MARCLKQGGKKENEKRRKIQPQII